jgi:hypothetical protein
MLRLCGCVISPEEADRLLDLLVRDGSAVSLEAAAALSWSRGDDGFTVDELEPELREAILRVLDDGAVDGGLCDLRTALSP